MLALALFYAKCLAISCSAFVTELVLESLSAFIHRTCIMLLLDTKPWEGKKK